MRPSSAAIRLYVAGVRAEVPDGLRRPRRGGSAGRGRPSRRSPRRRSSCSRRSRPIRSPPADSSFRPSSRLVQQSGLAAAADPPRAGRLDRLVGVPPLGPCVEVDVARQAESQPGPPRQEPAREVERDAVEVVAQEHPEPDVALGHQGERAEEVLAELAVRHPRRLGSARSNDRVSIRSAGRAVLDVVGGRVLQDVTRRRAPAPQVERQQGGVLELAERPLVRIRDELDRLGPDDRAAVPGSAASSMGDLDGISELRSPGDAEKIRWPGRRPVGRVGRSTCRSSSPRGDRRSRSGRGGAWVALDRCGSRRPGARRVRPRPARKLGSRPGDGTAEPRGRSAPGRRSGSPRSRRSPPG